MLPDQLEIFSGSALGALEFFSNFVFAFEDSYNADASALKPLLHTWSLGVEGAILSGFPDSVNTGRKNQPGKQNLRRRPDRLGRIVSVCPTPVRRNAGP
jgi:peptidoglycan/LPS O-acetylase OafA/YrhL